MRSEGGREGGRRGREGGVRREEGREWHIRTFTNDSSRYTAMASCHTLLFSSDPHSLHKNTTDSGSTDKTSYQSSTQGEEGVKNRGWGVQARDGCGLACGA